MQKPYLIFVLIVVSSCSSPKKISLTNLSSSRYQYIFDFQSRVAQEKMRILKNNYSKGSMAVSFIDALGNANNDPQQPDHLTEMPKMFRTVRIKNKGEGVLRVDLISEEAIDDENNCSILNIQLPKNRSITVLATYNNDYELYWHYASQEKKIYSFNTAGKNKLTISEVGVNPTTIDY